MAHDEHRAAVGLDQIFQQLQCLDVQVVGGFVQNQDIGRPGKQSCQQQAVALAARERTDGGGGTSR